MKLYNFDDWKFLNANKPARLEIGEPRMVKIEIVSAKPASIVFETGGGSLMSVWCPGREVYEFWASDYISVSAPVDIQVYTPEMEDTDLPGDDVSFTRIIERQARNPEVEAVYHVMYENTRRMMEQQAADRAEAERRYADLLRTVARNDAGNSGASPSGDDAGASAQHDPANADG